MKSSFFRLIKFCVSKFVLLFFRVFLQWPSAEGKDSSYSIMIGVPTVLKNLLPLNLLFIEKQKLNHLTEILIVFDRVYRSEYESDIEYIQKRFSHLPIRFLFYPTFIGRVVEFLNGPSWYNTMNQICALSNCKTSHLIVHDFDLYPTRPDYFFELYSYTQENNLDIAGTEYSNFYGLNVTDNICGTWALCFNVASIRNRFKPYQLFHTWQWYRGELVLRDPTVRVQFLSPKRGKVPSLSPSDYCHVNNLCSTALSVSKGKPFNIAWRFHLLIYLKYLNSESPDFIHFSEQMNNANSATIEFEGRPVNFSDVHITCMNVLKTMVMQLETYLYESARENVILFLDRSYQFISKFGDTRPVEKRSVNKGLFNE